jgi:glutaredoxin
MGIRMSEIIVFKVQTCPNCDRLEALLKEAGIEFRIIDMREPTPE